MGNKDAAIAGVERSTSASSRRSRTFVDWIRRGSCPVHSFEWNQPAREAAYKRALEVNPNYPTAHFWYGLMLDSLGRQQENLAMRRRAYELDPLNLQINVGLANALEQNRPTR